MKDFQTLDKIQNFVSDANIPSTIDAFITAYPDLGFKSRSQFLNVMTGRKSYSDVGGLFRNFLNFYFSRVDSYRNF